MAIIEGPNSDSLVEDLSVIETAFTSGRVGDVFTAFCSAVAGTEIRVGKTEAEDLTALTTGRVRDYIEGFLDATRDAIFHTFEENGTYDQLPEEQYQYERRCLLASIAARLSVTSTSD